MTSAIYEIGHSVVLGFTWGHLLWVSLPVLLVTFLVQMYLKAVYGKYSRVANRRGVTGAEAARRILARAGLHDVRVEESRGFLSDHYDPRNRVLRLSPDNYHKASVSAVGVAAHEAGHALQHAKKWAPLVLRNMAVPVASFGSGMGYIVLIIGVLIYYVSANPALALIGVAGLAAVALFQLINLPVEFDASRRAVQLLPAVGILDEDEVGGARSVLVAAALTYVAATAAAIWEIIYWLSFLGIIGGSSE